MESSIERRTIEHSEDIASMPTGRRFVMRTGTVAVEETGAVPSRSILTIPAGDTITVVSRPRDGDRMVDVLWEGKLVLMFAIDVQERGEEITDANAKS